MFSPFSHQNGPGAVPVPCKTDSEDLTPELAQTEREAAY
jgi:hypothetical protein